MTGNVQLATEGQLDELRICLEKSLNKLRGRISFTTADGWIGNSRSLDRFVEGLLPYRDIQAKRTYTRRLFADQKLLVPATDGTKTILDAEDVFTAGIDGDFKDWDCCATGMPTPETPAEVHELIEDAKFAEMFSGDLADRFWTSTAQITEFVVAHRDRLRGERWANFFPFKKGKKKFVAHAYRCSAGRLRADVGRFEAAGVWDAEDRRRLVVPQLAVSV